MFVLLAAALAAQPSKRPTDAERGEELYRRHCLACHGVANDGKGPLASVMVHPVPSLVGKVEVDEEQVRVVLKGREAMPAYEATFDAADARRVLGFMKGLSADSPLGPEKAKKGATRPAPRRPRARGNGEPAEEAEPEEEE